MPNLRNRFDIWTTFAVVLAQVLVAGSTLAETVSSSPTKAEIFSLHVLPEPLVPSSGEPTPAENAALASALDAFQKRGQSDDFSSLETFVTANPNSPWRLAVLTNLGLLYYHTGYFSKCIPTFQAAWEAGKNAADPKARALADRAAGEYTKMNARLGRYPELKTFLDETKGRRFTGQATELMAAGRGGAAEMETKPELAFRCGPLALSRIMASQKSPLRTAPAIVNAKSTMRGMSLSEVAGISRELGVKYQPAKRSPGAKLVFPCVVHWKAGHYAALIKEVDGRYLSDDPTFENQTWLTPTALEAESSGYFLLPPGPLPIGWTAVPEAEAKEVFGKGNTGSNSPTATSPTEQHSGGDNNKCKGMATYSFLSMVVSTSITDTPVGYQPPYGPPVNFQVTYNQREASQPSNFNYSNFGEKWNFAWLSYITDDPYNPPVASVAVGGGGVKVFSNFDPGSQNFGVQFQTQTSLKRVSTSPVRYEQSYPDGSKDVFAQSDGSTTAPRKVFLTQHLDPAGNAVTLSYDGQLRIVKIADAIGQVTTLSYELANDPYKITKVTDPFGRHADFAYDASGRLIQITDVIGIQSKFTYQDIGDFIESLTTPYGTTTFTSTESGRTRRVTATDPNGDAEVLEYNENESAAPYSLPSNQLPAGMFVRNYYMSARNSFYWDKKAWKEGANDYSKARLTHWLHTGDGTQADTGIESMKAPLEGRIWFNYPGQVQTNEGAAFPGTLNDKPSVTGRLLDDGTTQLYRASYNDLGLPFSTTDPVGRTTLYTYAANNIDLLTVSQKQASGTALLGAYTWNSQHLPLTYTDAAGQTTKYTWTATGQIATVTNAKLETTTFTYYADDAAGKQRKGRLASVDGALPGNSDVVAFDYDAIGNVATVTGPDGYALSFLYDSLDRLTRVTFPDATYTETVYQALTPQTTRDRLGRLTYYAYNNLRQLASVTDPANRAIQYRWCKCGALQQLIDAMGRVTTWRYDVEGRTTAKEYVDSSKVTYAYEPLSGRLSSITDEKGQVKSRSYNSDDTLAAITYTSVEHATPNVAFTYDSDYHRLKTMVDGIGTTTYAYYPVAAGTLGAGRLASVDGPLPDDTLTYSYDELMRGTGYAVNGIGESRSFDSLGRLLTFANPLGTFGYTYVGATSRIDKVTYPNGMTCQYSYHPLASDFRLKDIIHTLPGNILLSRHSYEYNVVGDITRWTQISPQANLNRSWLCSYDDADQLASVTSQDPDTHATLPAGQYAYTYDFAGNRLTETIDGVTTTASFNALNQLTSLANGGTSMIPQQTYEWDAEDRMVAINYPTINKRSEFAFDGLERRVRITEKSGDNITSDRRYIWQGLQLVEERIGAEQHRYFSDAMQIIVNGTTVSQVYARDHLGSVRELVSTSGASISMYDFDPWGRRKLLAGQDSSFNVDFANYWRHDGSNLLFTQYRTYNQESGRWLSRDPLGMAEVIENPNLYAYVGNGPTFNIDPLGLWQFTFTFAAGFGGSITFGYNSGQFNLGADVGAGAGLSFGYDPNDSGYHTPCLEGGARTNISAGLGGGFGIGAEGTLGSEGGNISGIGSLPFSWGSARGVNNKMKGTIHFDQDGNSSFRGSNSGGYSRGVSGFSGFAGVGVRRYF